MTEKKFTYVRVFYPGVLFAEDDTFKVGRRSPQRIARKYKNCFSFYFFDRIEKPTKVGGQKKVVTTSELNKSPHYFPNGELFTVEKLKKLTGDYKILISNMEINNWPVVVKTRCGNFQPFEKKDKILVIKDK